MWVPTGERECIHIGGKSIRIGDDVAGRDDDLLNRANGPPIVIVKCLKRRPRLPRSVQRDGKRYQRCADAGHDSSQIIGGMIFIGIER